MRRVFAMLFLAAWLVGATSGCGTLANMNGREQVVLLGDPAWAPERPTMPFGGVANDVAMIKKVEYPIGRLFWAADIPFSLVGDIVTAPWAAQRGMSVARRNSDETTEWNRFWLSKESGPPLAAFDRDPFGHWPDARKIPAADARGSLIR